jgi:hypothetical protein
VNGVNIIFGHFKEKIAVIGKAFLILCIYVFVTNFITVSKNLKSEIVNLKNMFQNIKMTILGNFGPLSAEN